MKKTMTKSNDKKFDAVKMMRSIRDNLGKRWLNHPDVMKKDLENTRKQFSRYFKE